MIAKKILLAEDDLDDQLIFHDFLQNRKDVTLLPSAENGEEVFDFMNKKDLPDLIILDQNMPKKNGLQTLQLLKENPEYSHIPVMIYSTYADQTLVQKSTDLGAALVYTKPVTASGYNEMIDAFLKLA